MVMGKQFICGLVLVVASIKSIAHACSSGHADHNGEHVNLQRRLQRTGENVPLWAPLDGIPSRCATLEPEQEDMEEMVLAVEEWRESRPDNPRVLLIQVPLYIHVMINTAGDGDVTDTQIQDQLDVLESAFGPLGIQFKLQAVIRTVNDDWYTCPLGGSEVDMKRALRQGGAETLNMYLCRPGGFLGWATLPRNYNG